MAARNSRAVVVSKGDLGDPSFYADLLRDDDYLVAADGGARAVLALGLLPAAVVGDLDSLDEATQRRLREAGCRLVIHPREKDYTDTKLAVRFVLDQGYREVLMLGAIGDRLDHTLGNLQYMAALALDGVNITMVNEKNTVRVVRGSLELSGRPGEYLSLIPLTPEVTRITITGFKYPLHDATLRWVDGLGISNEFIAQRATINCGEGVLLAITTRD